MKILLVGDFFPGLRLEKAMHQPPTEVLGSFASDIQQADLAIVNLEAPLTSHLQPILKTGPALKGSPQAAAFLKSAGFHLLALANNHILDFGEAGLQDTLDTLDKAGLQYVGAGAHAAAAAQPFWFTHSGSKLAVLNFADNEWSTTHGANAGANPIDPIENYRTIRAIKKQADFLLVITHSGHERYPLPSPRQKSLFRFYIEAGASAVVNHHPHCVSGYEQYQDGIIFYSLGNFLFDQGIQSDIAWDRGLGVTLQFQRDEPPSYALHHFEQCGPLANLRMCTTGIQAERMRELQALNEIILDDIRLIQAFEGWTSRQTKAYMSYIEPHKSRYIQALQNRGWLPSFWSKRKKLYLLNLIRCESHHDLLKTILERDARHPQ